MRHIHSNGCTMRRSHLGWIIRYPKTNDALYATANGTITRCTVNTGNPTYALLKEALFTCVNDKRNKTKAKA